MALTSDAVMVLYCDVDADPAGHDDWHTYEHMHERLSIPGFVRGTRWTRTSGSPRYLIVYEVADVDMASSPDYLERLNHPTAWTTSTMARLRGMRRGFCRVVGSAGYGLGRTAISMRFEPADASARDWLVAQLPRLASWRGMASVQVFEATAAPPMTKEQSIRGRDSQVGCVLLASAYDGEVLRDACERHLPSQLLEDHGLTVLDRGPYELVFTATAAEVARTPANPPLDAAARKSAGPRNPG
jgi:hypothetical protein